MKLLRLRASFQVFFWKQENFTDKSTYFVNKVIEFRICSHYLKILDITDYVHSYQEDFGFFFVNQVGAYFSIRACLIEKNTSKY